MTMIELTAVTGAKAGQAVAANADAIRYITKQDDGTTAIRFEADDVLIVKEDYAAVFAMLSVEEIAQGAVA
ncbi:MAG: hypothetical protein ACR2PG_26965 [Hyphomicrobiaceae bacterium]